MDEVTASVTYAMQGDPIAPVILGVTSILLFAVIGRFAARRLGQPTVLGELLMGILLGNLAWYLGIDLITVLREGPRVFEVVHQVLAGNPIEHVSVAVFGSDKGPEIQRIVQGPLGGQLMQARGEGLHLTYQRTKDEERLTDQGNDQNRRHTVLSST